MTETVRIYINSHPIEVDASATALDAIDAWDPAMAEAIRAGERLITDSRGMVTAGASGVHNGAIFRIVRARPSAAEDNQSNPL